MDLGNISILIYRLRFGSYGLVFILMGWFSSWILWALIFNCHTYDPWLMALWITSTFDLLKNMYICVWNIFLCNGNHSFDLCSHSHSVFHLSNRLIQTNNSLFTRIDSIIHIVKSIYNFCWQSNEWMAETRPKMLIICLIIVKPHRSAKSVNRWHCLK